MVTIIATNKHALFDYEIIKRFEAGIALFGQEVKSIKTGGCNLKGSAVAIIGNEAWLVNAHISRYKKSSPHSAYDPERSRKLLLNKKEIDELIGAKTTKGLTLIPLSVYSLHNRIKIEVAIARSKKKFEKREAIKKREVAREIKKYL